MSSAKHASSDTPARDRVAVPAVRGGEVVVVAERRDRAHRHRLLSLQRCVVPRLALHEQLLHPLLERRISSIVRSQRSRSSVVTASAPRLRVVDDLLRDPLAVGLGP